MSNAVHLALYRRALWWAEHLEFHAIHRELRNDPEWRI